MKNRSYKKHKAYMICYHIIEFKDYNNPRTQNIILYIIYNNKGYNKIIIPDQGFNKKSSNH